MILATLFYFINLFVVVYNVLLLVRVLMSWVPSAADTAFGRLIFELTEPILLPIRRALPNSQMVDFSPAVAFILLYLLRAGASYLIAAL